ncbi:glycoside hydrolase family 18 protein [Gramella lutea]|uniref:chitinase n=1 Tax=Christiangramia lutea TaxID=1607951 RepID=A0A9X1V1F5_9FLAO|nr:glycoside hydrolase family 18 protein [Christiangramia lutea]MCH4822450.1 glycoside hydrolase family 18 protein [Christiangramia lutea]
MKKFILITRSVIVVFLVSFCFSCKDKTEEKAELSEIEEFSVKNDDFKVIAYWTGSEKIKPETAKKLDQVIYSFLHLDGNILKVTERDSLSLRHLDSVRKSNPDLKILISLGGWGGCETCSEVFSSEKGRSDFTNSVQEILKDYNADGIDLDWEYPAIAGYQGHAFKPEDRENFTLLVKSLRNSVGEDKVISLAAGGFKDFLDKSVEWDKVMPLVDHVNIMTYDMVGGGSTKTGHHTSLYSTKGQRSSADRSIQYLDSLGVPLEKMVIGAAFYARVWENVTDSLNGLYQQGRFKESVLYRDLENYAKRSNGFEYFWDNEASAPYIYNAEKEVFITYDDSLSVSGKTVYALDNNLGGIMFWRLSGDKPQGLLDVINNEINNHEN